MKYIFRILFIFVSLLPFNHLDAQIIDPVKWTFTVQKASDCEAVLVFKAAIEGKYHLYGQKSYGDEGPIPTTFQFTKQSSYETIGKPSESNLIKKFEPVFGFEINFFEREATFKQKIKLKTDQNIDIKGSIEFMVCNDVNCLPPSKVDFSFTTKGSASCVTNETATVVANTDCTCDTTAIFKLFSDKEKNNAIKADTSVKTTSTAATITDVNKTSSSNDCNPWKTLLIGLGFGLGAVLMPCIYSLIPLTVSFFLKQSKSKASGIKNSLLYGFFIIFIFVALTMGITMIFGPSALSKIATNTGLNIFFFLLFVAFALSFFGLFEITLPSSWANKMDAKADKGGTIGIFFMALTLVIVSFSCTVGFMGNLINAVAKGDSYLCPFMGFTGFGAGIAFPFMLFAFFPSWLKGLPKSGGWMTTFKVTIAFLELALAVKFLANADNVNEWGLITREVFIALWLGIFAMLTMYLLGVFRTAHDDERGPLSIGRILWATIFLSFTLYILPGLWGAPLKLISSFPPPHYYAESPNGFGGGYHPSANSTDNSEQSKLENLRVTGPEGLMIFKDDYESALKYAKLVKKPLFIDFTGKACVNCRLMESTVWVTPDVLPQLQNEVVIVSLYVDSRVDLPISEQKEISLYGKTKTLTTYGDKWAYLESSKYNTNSQPLYVLVNDKEEVISNGPKGTERDSKIFGAWLKEGINKAK